MWVACRVCKTSNQRNCKVQHASYLSIVHAYLTRLHCCCLILLAPRPAIQSEPSAVLLLSKPINLLLTIIITFLNIIEI